MGVTFAILRLFGKIPEVNDWLIMVVIHLDTSAVINFKSSEEIPSCPLPGEAPKQKFSHMYLIFVALVRN